MFRALAQIHSEQGHRKMARTKSPRITVLGRLQNRDAGRWAVQLGTWKGGISLVLRHDKSAFGVLGVVQRGLRLSAADAHDMEPQSAPRY